MDALLWIIHPDTPDEFWDLIEGKDLNDTESIIEDLVYAHEQGWITILGRTDKSADDIKSIIEEHFDVDVIRPEPLDSSSNVDNGKPSERRAKLR